MLRENPAALRRIKGAPGSRRPAAAACAAGNFGSLLLDGSGLVFKCSETAAKMLGGSVDDVEGSPIGSFISDLLPSNTSPSFKARYLAHLSNMGSWRGFQSIGLGGQHVPVELAVAKLNSDGASVFLLHLRQPPDT